MLSFPLKPSYLTLVKLSLTINLRFFKGVFSLFQKEIDLQKRIDLLYDRPQRLEIYPEFTNPGKSLEIFLLAFTFV